MIRIKLLIVFCLFANGMLFSQITVISQSEFGGSSYDDFEIILKTEDNGFLIGGSSSSGISGNKTEPSMGAEDYWVLKLDGTENIIWQNTIGGAGNDYLEVVLETLDGGFILGGTSDSDISGDKSEDSRGLEDYWVLKLDAVGEIQWQRTIGGSQSDRLSSIVLHDDGGFILAGTSNSDISGEKTENSNGGEDYWIVKIDPTGSIEWQNTIGGNMDDMIAGISNLTESSDFIIAGSSESDISGDKDENAIGLEDYWILRIDDQGNIVWQETVGGGLEDVLTSVRQMSNGTILLGGDSYSGISGDKDEPNIGSGTDFWVVNLDSQDGSILWQNTIGGNLGDHLKVIKENENGEIFLSGYSFSDISGDKTEDRIGMFDNWIVNIDSEGTVNWDKTLGGDDTEFGNDILLLGGTTFYVACTSFSGISGDKTLPTFGGGDFWLVKLELVLGIVDQATTLNLSLYPNPTKDILTIQNQNDLVIESVSLYDTLGRKVMDGINATESIDVSNLTTGIYFIHIATDSGIVTKKVIKE